MMRKPIVIVGGALVGVVLVVAVAAVVWTLRDDDPNLLTEAPAIPTGTAAAATTPSAASTTPDSGAADVPEGVLAFVVDASGSSAKYVVEETLSGLPATAVGETTDVTGTIYLTEEGLAPGLVSSFQVDLRTLQSDEGRRDNFIRGNTLNTDEFPFAEFVITDLTAFPADYVEDSEVELTLTGDLTIRGETRPITWAVKARLLDGVMTAVADTAFNMTDFGIDPPQVALAQAEDGVVLQVVLLLRQQT
jgi:polyisoprenoid-binding protein YceI